MKTCLMDFGHYTSVTKNVDVKFKKKLLKCESVFYKFVNVERKTLKNFIFRVCSPALSNFHAH